MPTRCFLTIIAAALVLAPLAAQVPTQPGKKTPKPVFSPPEPGEGQESKPAKPDKNKPDKLADKPAVQPVDPPKPVAPADAVDGLLNRLSRWPDKAARDAATALSGLGPDVESRLIQALGHNDWRVQAGAARALAEMGSKAAVKPLAAAIHDPTNLAALSELMSAIVRIDPQNGPKEVIPFLTHQAGRVREGALKALPSPLDARYADDAVQLFRSRSADTRAIAITVLTRIPDSAGREEFIHALADPEVRVANQAARHLAALGDETTLKRLATLAREGALRQVSYAFLALAIAEDTRGIVLVADADPARERAYQMLQGDDPFYRAAAAVFLSNLSFRADDATLRAIADKYLVPILLDAVAGGVFFNDYVAVEDLAYRKLELLTGENFGPNAPRWKTWWARAADAFHAKHQLRSLSAADLVQCTVSVRVEETGGRIRSAFFVGDAGRATAAMGGMAFVLGERDCEALKAALESSRFFLGRSDLDTGGRARSLTEITVQRGTERFTRRHAGETPAELVPLVNTLFDLARALSWQRFAPAESAARARYIDEQTDFFRTADADSRRERLLGLALAGYPTFVREGRQAAVELFLVSSPEFRSRNAARLVELLRSEPALDDQAAGLISVLSAVDAVPVRDQVLAFLGRAPGARTNDVVRDYLSRQPRTNVIAALRSESAATRIAAAETLVRWKGDKDVVSILIEAIADFDPRVREAAVRTLATFEDDRIPAMLEAAIGGQDKGLRVRAIEALGAVQKGAAVPRLMEVFRGGDNFEKFAVIRSLGAIAEKRATIALGSIVRESSDASIGAEALSMLGKSAEEGAAAEVADIFKKTRSAEIRLQAMDALATVLGPDAIPDLLPGLDSEDADFRRASLLTLARLGARETLPRLLKVLEKPEGDPGAEFAFHRLTFVVSAEKAPAQRLLAYKRFAEESGAQTRSEWFVKAVRALKPDPAVLESWDPQAPLDAARFGLLVRVVQDGNWALRGEAEARILSETGIKLAPLARSAGPDEIQERVAAFRRWLEANPEGLTQRPKPKPKPAESRPESR